MTKILTHKGMIILAITITHLIPPSREEIISPRGEIKRGDKNFTNFQLYELYKLKINI